MKVKRVIYSFLCYAFYCNVLHSLQMTSEVKLEGNVLLEPAAAMNQMLILKCFINVDKRILSEILQLK